MIKKKKKKSETPTLPDFYSPSLWQSGKSDMINYKLNY